MNIPELIVTEEILPSVRFRASRELRDHGWSQSSIASVLGISQVMVSKYLKEEQKTNPTLLGIIDRISREITAGALSGEGIEKLSIRFCSVLEDCISEGMISDRFKERFGVEPHRYCFLRGPGTNRRERVLADMESAISLLKSRDLGGLIPALKINIAQAVPEPSGPEDIAAFPGRIETRNDVVTGARPAEFGASKHLSKVLLSAAVHHSWILSAGSIYYNERIGLVLKDHEGFHILRRGSDDVECLTKKADRLKYMVDPGDFGVEPCLYIFGHNSLEVAMAIIEVKRLFDGGEE